MEHIENHFQRNSPAQRAKLFEEYIFENHKIKMAPTLGKRKRKTEERTKVNRESSSESSIIEEEDAQAIFRRHFEAQFKPLPIVAKPAVEQIKNDDEDDNEESDWDGISDEEVASGKVEVIEHTAKESRSILSKMELKSFMVSEI